MANSTPRRTVLAAALAAVAGTSVASTAPAAAAAAGVRGHAPAPALVDQRSWVSFTDWRGGDRAGTRAVAGRRPGLVIGTPAGVTDYADPHTGTTSTWEYASWTSPVHASPVPATEVIASWNADTPPGTWIQIELRGTYSDATATPWYVMGRWAAGDGDIRRTSVDDQSDGKSSVWTDTFSVDDPASGLRLNAYQLRLTLYRAPGTELTPLVWRLGAMASDIPDRFTVPASTPCLARELHVPRYSQNTHVGQYPEYDNGGEAWCSPTSSQMIVEYWGRRPSAEDLAWVDPAFEDPQVCHAARFTFDHQYEGCGNWPFNAAYAATYPDMNAVVTRLRSLTDLETLIRAGIPAITSQSFRKEELTGAGYGTSGHLMTVIGFTADGDVIANDPASPNNEAVRRVYKRREWENIWLRTKRYDANGKVRSGTGGVCYVFWPVKSAPSQHRALRSLGLV
ncbi:peptidase C39 family protein [Streptomyces sp. Je 1-79]|uniref:peptidase C39 family protein n=1 Tax=Streptomyces sp. Je 1-79 TaxID=2943847 RepID=UPI0021A77AC4|nr:peptidase C39 family protein [Streptomyces sp. Je 1-79]MCT4357450.1 peptidase C39 family protein [Streptomyces sp. Je 1-79]